jgi:hypothetical protein
MTMVADTSRMRSTLDWTPRYDDLETIASHALAWEEKLFRDAAAARRGIGLKSGWVQVPIWLEKPGYSGQGDGRFASQP